MSIYLSSRNSYLGYQAPLMQIFRYSASSNQTIFSGSSLGGTTLAYSPGQILVTLNGTVLIPEVDYTALTGTSITLYVEAYASDELTIFAFNSINLANCYTYAQAISGYVGLDNTQTISGSKTFSSPINGTLNGGVVGTVTGTNSTELVRGNMADNDFARILVGSTGSNAGYLEIATADDGTEPIYVRQYTGVFSSLTRTATLLDGSGNTTFPGYVYASRVYNSVYNDIADFLETENNVDIEYGKCYTRKNDEVIKSSEYCQKGIIGIASDTFGYGLGKKDIGNKEIPIAVAGFVLAHCDEEYETGTALTCTIDGKLTEISEEYKMKYPERIVATFYKKEKQEFWNDIEVKGRHWVKIK